MAKKQTPTRANKPICVAVDEGIMKKVRQIMFAKSSPEHIVTLKETFDEALLDFISKYEAEHGMIMEA